MSYFGHKEAEILFFTYVPDCLSEKSLLHTGNFLIDLKNKSLPTSVNFGRKKPNFYLYRTELYRKPSQATIPLTISAKRYKQCVDLELIGRELRLTDPALFVCDLHDVNKN